MTITNFNKTPEGHKLFLEGCEAYHSKTHGPSATRYGQHCLKTLAHVRPDIAADLNATMLDPFYDDARVGDFLYAVRSLWPA